MGADEDRLDAERGELADELAAIRSVGIVGLVVSEIAVDGFEWSEALGSVDGDLDGLGVEGQGEEKEEGSHEVIVKREQSGCPVGAAFAERRRMIDRAQKRSDDTTNREPHGSWLPARRQ
jgi:hypothetical protein